MGSSSRNHSDKGHSSSRYGGSSSKHGGSSSKHSSHKHKGRGRDERTASSPDIEAVKAVVDEYKATLTALQTGFNVVDPERQAAMTVLQARCPLWSFGRGETDDWDSGLPSYQLQGESQVQFDSRMALASHRGTIRRSDYTVDTQDAVTAGSSARGSGKSIINKSLDSFDSFLDATGSAMIDVAKDVLSAVDDLAGPSQQREKSSRHRSGRHK
nr:uncharacterized protein CI109_005576 [Kwoniella shandongensis]KAA5526141.1 hypothetical protein CI109_005576 [Kwoniella shandongensis]